jgi:hypothetical protein
MTRLRVLACSSVMVSVLSACSLLVSTTGLAGSGEPSADGGDAPRPVMPLGEAGGDGAGGDGGQATADAARDPDLLAEYSFEDPAGGKVHDSSGNAYDGVLGADATLVADGVRGRCLAVKGMGFFVVSGLSAMPFPSSGTLSLWFRFDFDATMPGGERSVFDGWDNTRSHLFMRRADDLAPGRFQIALQPSNAGYSAVTELTPTRSTWTHVVVSWDEVKGEGAYYADRVPLGRDPYARPFVPTGQMFRMGEGMIGNFDEVRLYKRALTEAEILTLD